MSLLKKIKKLFQKKEKNLSIWSKTFKTWEASLSESTSYNSDFILNLCREALLKVKNGEAAFERDSVAFKKMNYDWKILTALQHVCIKNNNQLSVLDFGGSLGSKYFQNKSFFENINKFEWSVVEQKSFVEVGKNDFSNKNLSFFFNIKECILERKPNVILLNSVLQYLENPYLVLDELLKTSIPNIIIDRTSFIDEDVDLLCVQDVPTYKAKLPHWFLSYPKFLNFLKERNREIMIEDLSDIQFNNLKLKSVSKFLIIK